MGDFTVDDGADDSDWGDAMLLREFGLGRGSGTSGGVEVGLEELIEGGLGPVCTASFDVDCA